jgi:putative protease
MKRPEVLAPAGDAAALDAAIRGGADAVYFGLHGFNARARATNFDETSLGETIEKLHRHGVKGYVTLNTLVFDGELSRVEEAIRACAAAGVDAIIVQDLGVARLAKAIAPEMPIHASTQMTCTDASSVELAKELGCKRVVLARELSTADIDAIAKATDVELEVFVHGALCIAYSGQCLTSEAIGGRSANRGACAQSCRLPYELIVDGEKRDLGDKAYLLSPEDLEGTSAVPGLARAGVASLKIEGRLKGPEYVFATARLYRDAVEGAVDEMEKKEPPMRLRHVRAPRRPRAGWREDALQTYSRGSGPGFLKGVDHQRLVDGRTCDHRGVVVGEVRDVCIVQGKSWLRATLSETVAKGDGVLVEGGFGGEGEVGGRVWEIDGDKLWLGPDVKLPKTFPKGRRLFRTSSPPTDKRIHAAMDKDAFKTPLAMRIAGREGEAPTLHARSLRDGREAEVTLDAPLARATQAPTTRELLEEKLGRLGDSPFALAKLDVDLPNDVIVPMSALNRARRAVVAALDAKAKRAHATTSVTAADLVASTSIATPERTLANGLFVLCRNLDQARAALASGADGVWLDFLELTGTGAALRALRDEGARFVGVAPPRIRKPGEEKIDRYLQDLEPDAILVRGLGALREGSRAPKVGDFSLNVTNRLSAAEVMRRGLSRFTPSFDLDEAQLSALLDGPLAALAEVVVHHPMPLFHMEHCVIAALLSNGGDYKTCGRPCEKHQVALEDRAGMVHPVEADVGCRNTVFHAAAQSAASLVPMLVARGVSRFRIELVREDPAQVAKIVELYKDLIAKKREPQDVVRALRVGGGYGVVRGSLRVVHSP